MSDKRTTKELWDLQHKAIGSISLSRRAIQLARYFFDVACLFTDDDIMVSTYSAYMVTLHTTFYSTCYMSCVACGLCEHKIFHVLHICV